MDSLILFETELQKNRKAKCPRCDGGVVEPVFPEHKEIWDFSFKKCGYKIHFEKMVVVR